MEIILSKKMVQETEIFVNEYFSNNTDGHDWWHTNRVRKLSLQIAKEEGYENLLLIELIALLHDVDDWKITKKQDLSFTTEWLTKLEISTENIIHICKAIKDISFKGASVDSFEFSIETKIVQDADRIDAIGAIGIARAFAYGGSQHRPLYNPDEKPVLHTTESDYRNSKGHTINHFYEKLLLLKDRMHTNSAKKIAEERHLFMENFLKQFYSEW